MIHPHFPHYFSYHVNREVKEVYWHSVLFTLATSLTFIFEPIYLYSLNYSLIQILWFYALVYSAYAVLIFLGAEIISKIGYKHAIFISSFFYILYWILLYKTADYHQFFYMAPIFFALQKSFFWPALDSDIAINSVKKQTGHEIGMLLSIIQLVSVGAPFLGGFISARFGFLALFITASALILSSVVPLFKSPEIYMRHRFHFRNFFAIFKKHFRNFFGYWGFAEDLMLMSLWPIFIFIIVPDLLNVGIITTVASVAAVVLMLYVGQLTDEMDKRKLIQLSSIFYGLTWMFRFLARTVSVVVAFDILTKLGKGTMSVPMSSLSYQLAGAEKAEHAIAYNVFWEFSLSIGKIITALLGILILVTTGNIFYVFILAGFFTLFYGLLRK